MGEDCLLAGARRVRGEKSRGAISTEIRRDDPATRRGEKMPDLVVGVNVVGEAVEEEDRRPARRTALLEGDVERARVYVPEHGPKRIIEPLSRGFLTWLPGSADASPRWMKAAVRQPRCSDGSPLHRLAGGRFARARQNGPMLGGVRRMSIGEWRGLNQRAGLPLSPRSSPGCAAPVWGWPPREPLERGP